MTWPGRIARRVRALFEKPTRERELDEEIRFHLEMEAAKNEREGMSPAAARAAAERAFGGVDRYKEECRDARGVRPLEDLAGDLHFGLRALRRSPSFTAVVVLTLALGIGGSTAIFSAVDGVLLKPLPYADAHRIVALWQHDRQEGGGRQDVSPANFLDIRERSTSFEALAAAEPYALDYTGPDGPESIRTWLVSDGFFDALGTPARLGRTFRPEEYTAGRNRVIVLGDGLWRRQFGADPGVVGRTLTLDGEPHTIVGVMPRAFRFPAGREMWAPRVFSEDDRKWREANYLIAVGRLKPGVTVAAARAEVGTIAARLAVEHPRTNTGVGVMLVPLPEEILGHVRPALLLLFGAVGFVLLIACANVANLVLARTVDRGREFVIRAALGAGRGRVVRQLATESVLLALLGAAGGVLIAWCLVELIQSLSPASLPRVDELRIDGRALGFTFLVSLATACLFGFVPALRASGGNLHDRLKLGVWSATAGRSRLRLRGALVVGEVALALVLLVGAGLLVRSFVSLLRVERGFRTDNILAITMFAWGQYPEEAQRTGFVRETVDRLAALPGVRAAGMASSLPLAEQIGPEAASFAVEGRPAPRVGEEPIAHVTIATEGYFEALGIALHRGRLFGRLDDAKAPPVLLINQTLARRYFRGQNPIGERLTFDFRDRPRAWEIVGVVADVRQTGLAADPSPAIFIPHAQSPAGEVIFTVRTAGNPLAMLDRVKEEIWAVNRSMAIYRATTLDAVLTDAFRERRFHLALLGGFSVLALALAAVGVYGVLSRATSERTQEIGVRIALGARTADVLALVMRQGALLALIGVAAGLLGAAALTRMLRGMLFGVEPLDLATFAGGAVLVLAVAAIACYLPAKRAGRLDPVRALRAE